MNLLSTHPSRRSFLLITAGAAASTFIARAADAPLPTGPYKLAPLPYAFDALDPHINTKTMEIHHGKHHSAYVTKLNEAVAGTAINGEISAILSDLSKVPEKNQPGVRNMGGGHYNHTLFWSLMAKPGPNGVGGAPAGKIGAALEKTFGSFVAFQAKFAEAGLKRFGSGWAWLIAKPDGSLAITTTANQDNPLMKGIVPEAELGTPLLAIDVWEHAYYLNYQNRRADYISAWWNVVNWNHVDELLGVAVK